MVALLELVIQLRLLGILDLALELLLVLIWQYFVPTFSFPSKAGFFISLPHIIQLSEQLFFALIRPLPFSSLLPKLSPSRLGPLPSQQVPFLAFLFQFVKIQPSPSTLFPSKPVWLPAQLVYLPKQRLQRFLGWVRSPTTPFSVSLRLPLHFTLRLA